MIPFICLVLARVEVTTDDSRRPRRHSTRGRGTRTSLKGSRAGQRFFDSTARHSTAHSSAKKVKTYRTRSAVRVRVTSFIRPVFADRSRPADGWRKSSSTSQKVKGGEESLIGYSSVVGRPHTFWQARGMLLHITGTLQVEVKRSQDRHACRSKTRQGSGTARGCKRHALPCDGGKSSVNSEKCRI